MQLQLCGVIWLDMVKYLARRQLEGKLNQGHRPGLVYQHSGLVYPHFHDFRFYGFDKP